MTAPQSILERRAEGVPCADLADALASFDRYTGSDPRLLVAEAAATTTGGRLSNAVAAVEAFRESFVDAGRVDSLAELAAVDPDDEDLVAAFGPERQRHVLLTVADVLANRPEDDDLAALQAWAGEADVFRYEADPIGAIDGVGPASFQQLRLLAGADVVAPRTGVTTLIQEMADDIDESEIDAETPLRTIAAAEWLAIETSFRRAEIDRLGWWHGVDEAEREAELERLAL
ncbi:hypothetical protein OB905_04960 [Halobacteria archaeon AArc-dxtr1]|nr:hypothetical protein [Halobacteria archaeon AArc-dxtr1]